MANSQPPQRKRRPTWTKKQATYYERLQERNNNMDTALSCTGLLSGAAFGLVGLGFLITGHFIIGPLFILVGIGCVGDFVRWVKKKQ